MESESATVNSANATTIVVLRGLTDTLASDIPKTKDAKRDYSQRAHDVVHRATSRHED